MESMHTGGTQPDGQVAGLLVEFVHPTQVHGGELVPSQLGGLFKQVLNCLELLDVSVIVAVFEAVWLGVGEKL